MLLVIFGPRTRLAQAVLVNQWIRDQDLLMVARNADELGWIARTYPQAAILPSWESRGEVPGGHKTVGILCCALGLIHPAAAEPSAHVRDAMRDLVTLERVVHAYHGARVHALFVSSVLALSPVGGREYYGGWKCVLEGVVARIIESRPGACLSVIYPGRLVERREFATLTSVLHTSYRRAAGALIRRIRSETPGKYLVGLDARLWLAVQGGGAVGRAIAGWI